MSPDHSSLQTYLIAYELRGDADLAADRVTFLTDCVRAVFPMHCNPMRALWFVLSDLPISAIRDHLSPYMAAEDKLCVTLVGGACAWRGLAAGDGRWLVDHL